MNILHQVHVAYRLLRRKVRRRLWHIERAKARKALAAPFQRPRWEKTPDFDSRSSIDRFRRESGQR